MSVRRVFFNGLYQASATAIGVLARLGLLALLGRMFGAEGLGIWSIVMVVNGFCMFLANTGMKGYATYIVARGDYQPGELLVRSLPINLVGSLTAFGISLGFLKLLNYSDQVVLGAAIVNATLVFDSLVITMNGIFNGKQRMGKTSIINLLNQSLLLVLGVPGILIFKDLAALFVALSLSKIILLFIAAIMFRSTFGALPWRQLNWGLSLRMAREALPFAMQNFVNQGFNRVDILILSLFLSEAVVGMYNACIVIAIRLNSLIRPFNTALFPAMTENFETNRSMYQAFLKKGVKYLLCLSLPLAAFVLYGASDILTIIYGPDLAPAAPMLQVLSFMIVFRVLNPLLSNGVTACGHQVYRTKTLTVAFIFNGLLNLALVPVFYGMGAAWSSVLTEIMAVSAYAVFLYKKGVLTFQFKDLKPLAFGAFIAVIYGAGYAARNWFFIFQGALVGLCALSTCFAVKILSVEEVGKIISRIHKKPSSKKPRSASLAS